jgi:hypothetical protein
MTFHVEPHDSEQAVGSCAGEQIGNLGAPDVGSDTGLRDEHWVVGKIPDLAERGAEQLRNRIDGWK